MTMKRVVLVLGVLLCAALGASAQQLSKAERDALVDHLKRTEKALKEETKGLTPAQWDFKSAPDRWSVRECLEHITVSEDFLFGLITDRVMKTSATPEKYDAARAREADAQIQKVIADRSQKFQAPEPVRPTGRWASTDEMWEHFVESRQRTIAFAGSDPGLRLHFMDGPGGAGMDGYQWILFLSTHSSRHTAQIREVKADPNFPKK